MKLDIILTSSGSQISRSAQQMPPLGALFTALQDSVLTASTTLTDIAAKADGDLPPGFQVFHGSDIYGWTGTGWEDGNTSEPVGDASISASFTVRNPASYDIGITW